MALLYLTSDKLVGSLPVVVINHAVLYRYPSCRKLIYHRDVQITIHYYGKGSRYRCGTHDHNMGIIALKCQVFSLSHSKSVLLICYNKPQLIICNLLLDQGMGSYYYVRPVFTYIAAHKPFFLCRHRTAQQDNFYIIRFK